MPGSHSGRRRLAVSRASALVVVAALLAVGEGRAVRAEQADKAGPGPPNVILIMVEIFSGKGYQTGLVGKWHLGDRPPFLPHRQGFGRTCYINKSNNQTKELWRGDELLEKPFDNRLLTAPIKGAD